jgi:hypothetical protein
MFREEAVWIESALQKIEPSVGNNLVANLGSSTAYFREVIQPHIHQHIILPLQHKGWKIVNVDLKHEDGVDIVADVTKDNFSQLVQPAALTICTNMLEHVEDINLVVTNLQKVTTKGGYILLTVPYKYKKHLDPIDNMFRPTPNEIAALFNKDNINIIDQKVIQIFDKIYYKVKKSKFPIWGYRHLLGYYLGKKHAVSGILIQMK